MSVTPFFKTRMGQRLYESTMPELVRQLEKLNGLLMVWVLNIGPPRKCWAFLLLDFARPATLMVRQDRGKKQSVFDRSNRARSPHDAGSAQSHDGLSSLYSRLLPQPQ